MIDEAAIRLRWDTVGSRLDERGRRLFAAAEVRTAGRGGLATVSKITGLARSTINRGKADLDAQPLPSLPGLEINSDAIILRSASRVGLTPSPTYLPGQGGFPQGDAAISAMKRVAR